MIGVRFHGRGGQGAKIASRILGRSGFICGLQVQDFALFGAERRGAPVVSFTRLSPEPIDQRGYIERPTLVIVMDDSLLTEARAWVFQGVSADTPVFVNGDPEHPAVDCADLPHARLSLVDMSAIARKLTGGAFVNAAAAAVAARCIPAIYPAALDEAVRTELLEFGLAPESIEKNVALARQVYGTTAAVELGANEIPPAATTLEPTAAYPAAVELMGPTIRSRGTARLRATGNWRIEQPVIDVAACKRCFVCYLYCPEAAVRLDGESFPHIDYDHCKGCMICYEECPTDAIGRKVQA